MHDLDGDKQPPYVLRIESESDIGNDITSISNNILGTSNRKNLYPRFTKNI